MGKIRVILAVFTIFLLSCMTVHAMTLEYDGEIHEYDGSVYTLIVNDTLINPPLAPIIFNDHALVPVREIFEELGAEVSYDGDTQTVTIEKEDYFMALRINDNTAYVNGDVYEIPDGVVPKLISELEGETKTMVPVRFISESIGLQVDFDGEHGAILVESPNYSFDDGGRNEQPSDKAPITRVETSAEDGNKFRITAYSTRAVGKLSDFKLDNPKRVVLDIYGAVYSGEKERIDTDVYGIQSIRLGDNGERARIVIDYSDIKGYYIEKKSDTEVSIVIETRKSQQQQPSAPKPSATAKPKPPSGTPVPNNKKLIMLDAGHGGEDCGAIGEIDGKEIFEKDLTLQITYKVKERLEERGYTVAMTRTGDTLPSLKERPEMANAQNAAVFVSIHINSVDGAPQANGTEIYYAESNNGDTYGVTSQTLAKNILDRMLKYMGSTNRGVKTAEHAVTKRCNMPATLVEIGFITNPEEIANMTNDEYQYKAAQGITEGIMITLDKIKMPQ